MYLEPLQVVIATLGLLCWGACLPGAWRDTPSPTPRPATRLGRWANATQRSLSSAFIAFVWAAPILMLALAPIAATLYVISLLD